MIYPNLKDWLGPWDLPIMAAVWILFIGITWYSIHRSRIKQRRLGIGRLNRGLCPSCGYDLRGNVSGVCPECGSRMSR